MELRERIDDEHRLLLKNARPVQPTNGRQIRYRPSFATDVIVNNAVDLKRSRLLPLYILLSMATCIYQVILC